MVHYIILFHFVSVEIWSCHCSDFIIAPDLQCINSFQFILPIDFHSLPVHRYEETNDTKYINSNIRIADNR